MAQKQIKSESVETQETIRRGPQLPTEVVEAACLSELVGPEIGSNQDFESEAMRKEMWKSLEKAERDQNSSTSRSSLMREGFHAGFCAAADDFLNGKATVEHFEKLREHRDISDFYAIGFELGYYRKLSEILIG